MEDYKSNKGMGKVNNNMIADTESNKKSSPIVNKLFLIGRKLDISLVFISQSYFKVPKTIRLNATLFIMKIPNKRKLQQIALIICLALILNIS